MRLGACEEGGGWELGGRGAEREEGGRGRGRGSVRFEVCDEAAETNWPTEIIERSAVEVERSGGAGGGVVLGWIPELGGREGGMGGAKEEVGGGRGGGIPVVGGRGVKQLGGREGGREVGGGLEEGEGREEGGRWEEGGGRGVAVTVEECAIR